MNQKTWQQVDDYLTDLFVPDDPTLEAVLEASARAGLPPHSVSPCEGRLLTLLAMTQGARRILEIGTLGGYSTIFLARALPHDGRLITLEVDPKHAEVAAANIAAARFADAVEVRCGRALDLLSQLVREEAGPFDLIFLDADKTNNPKYLEWSIELSRPGTLLIADNVIRNGNVVDSGSTDPSVLGIREFHEMLAADSRFTTTTIQTVGRKGYDGMTISRFS